ncbi:hypothetical protein IE53DRAFT_386080 [Violaceomyces palustris]|uniref:Uncharacterized protein n=1 Tax=Violaceomyces palustris TaxID=1673888 RepID=A0ACD0P0G6_9BASI|nr:hypothetical protein IE53DRAFT_386080 [Violaceomyces palustris]
MSTISNPSSRKARQDVDELLADLENLGTDQPPLSSRATATSASSSTAAVTPSEAAATSSSAASSNPNRSSSDSSSNQRQQPPNDSRKVQDAQSLLDDLDNLVQSRPSLGSRSANQRPSSASQPPSTIASEPAPAPTDDPQTVSPSSSAPPASAPVQKETTSSGGGGWGGWGSSLFSQATKLADQARQEIEKRAPIHSSMTATNSTPTGTATATATSSSSSQPPSSDTVVVNSNPKAWVDFATKGVRGFVKEAGLDKLGEDLGKVGKRGWNEILNAVAPPIAAHEVIQVTLSHDMVGYDGIEEVTFRVLSKVMEQVDNQTEQQLIVNKAPDETSASRPKQVKGQERDLNWVEGFQQASKLAEVNLEEVMKNSDVAKKNKGGTSGAGAGSGVGGGGANSVTLPITTCPIFVRIQPCLAALPWVTAGTTTGSGAVGAGAGEAGEKGKDEKHLFFLIMLKDPSHGLSHTTMSQALPSTWLDVPFEENLWVEDAMVDILSGALNVIGQDYVQGRMSGRSRKGLIGVGDEEARKGDGVEASEKVHPS